MNNKLKTFFGILALAIFIGAAYFLYNNLTDKYKPIQKEQEDERIKAPDFTVLDSEGKSVKLSDFYGKPIVLNFWASWCPPCKSEMPHFNKIYAEVGEVSVKKNST